MKLLITIVTCLSLLRAGTPHQYQDAIALWQKKVPKEGIFSLKELSNDKEMCGPSPCELFYFLSENREKNITKHTNFTVLLVAGLRGDDATSPNILLNAYGQLDAARTIFFPIANPSGFNSGTLPTQPGGINVEKDLPIGENQECNRSAAVMGLHYLYRTYPIDLTIYVHDGKPTIAYSWGRKYQGDSKAEDFGIYADIADMVRFEGNNEKQLDPVEAGSAYELKESGNVGDFVDWAYGASKYPAILSKKCGGKPLVADPKLTMNGLVLSLGVGKIQAADSAYSVVEKQFKRSFHLIEKIVRITNPRVKLEIVSKKILLSLEGCKAGSVTSIKILKESGEPLFQKQGDNIVKGDVTYGPPETKIFALPKETVIPSGVKYEVAFDCDNGWANIGRTAFSKVRSFTQKGIIIIQQQSRPIPTQSQKPDTLPEKQQLKPQAVSDSDGEGWQTYQIVIVSLLILVSLVWMINGIRLGLKAQRKQRIKNFNEKFETVEVVEDLESYSENLDEKETPERVEVKQLHQDADKARLNPA